MPESWSSFLPDNALGKFVSRDTLLKVLPTAALRWSRPGTFNDPFDCQPRFTVTPASDEVVEECVNELVRVLSGSVLSLSLINPLGKLTALLAEGISQGKLTLDEAVSDFREGVKETKTSRDSLLQRHHEEVVLSLQDAKILCLTKAFESILMWSHYAANHTGALVIFGPLSNDSQFNLAEPVIYSDAPIEFAESALLAKLLSGQISGSEPEYVSKSIKRIIYTKSESWSYEREWRIYAGSGFQSDKEAELNNFHRDDVLAVVFGANYQNEEVVPFVKAASEVYPKVKWFVARRSSRSIHLIIEELA